MDVEIAKNLAVSWDPDIEIQMQSTNKTIEETLGLTKNVPFIFGDITVYLVFASPVQSGFLPPKRATIDCNRSRTNPDIAGTEPDHLGPVFCSPWN